MKTKFVCLSTLLAVILLTSCSPKKDYCLELMTKVDDAYRDVSDANLAHDITVAKQKVTQTKTELKEAGDNLGDDKCKCTAVQLWLGQASAMVAHADTTTDIVTLKFFTEQAIQELDKAMKSIDDCTKK